ncbi:MAG: hypothetical protein V1914_03240 [archaeon]
MAKIEHSPTLNTVIMVETTLKNMENSIMTIPELKRKLPKKVNHNTLMTILEYLEKSNKILMSVKGIIYTHTSPRIFKKMMAEGIEH